MSKRAKRLIVRILINAAAVWVAAQLVSGITLKSDALQVLIVAVVFGLINAVLKPLAKLLTFPIIIFTLGLFTLVINAAMLLITDALSVGLEVNGFGAALLGGIVISVVSWALSTFLPDD